MAQRPHNVLTVDTETPWRKGLGKALKQEKVAHDEARNLELALEAMQTGDFTAVITGGLSGGWREIVHSANSAGMNSVFLAHGTLALGTAQEEGVVAFLKSAYIPTQHKTLAPIIDAALNPPTPEQ